jgi:cytochrome c-type biogenesis protein
MDSYLAGALTAAWLGILTSISPCPLATNIAGISYIGRQVGSPRKLFLSGLVYTLGRMLTYSVISIIVIASLLSIPDLSQALQKYMNRILGPLLLVMGLFLLGTVRFRSFGVTVGISAQRKVDQWGVWGAGLLGILFALSFCPVSAGLFFGSLIPLSVSHNSTLLFPVLYGSGTALPVILFAFLLAFGVQSVAKAFDRLKTIERWLRIGTGWVFILAGCYYSLIYIFGVNL